MSNLKIDRIFSFAHHSPSLFPSYPFPYHSLILRHLKAIYRIHHHQTCKIMDTLIACEHFQSIKLNLVNTHSDIFSHRQILWNSYWSSDLDLKHSVDLSLMKNIFKMHNSFVYTCNQKLLCAFQPMTNTTKQNIPCETRLFLYTLVTLSMCSLKMNV